MACAPVDEVLAFFIDHLPPQQHLALALALATREEPTPPLARWRAHRQVTELRQDDLRLAADEAAAFLGQTLALARSAAQVAVLARRTGGWVAGVQLAAISLQGHPDTDQFIQSFSRRSRHLQDLLLLQVLLRPTSLPCRPSCCAPRCGTGCAAGCGTR